MKKWIFCLLVTLSIVSYSSYAKASKQIDWSGLASINIDSIEEKARKYLLLDMPELKDVEIKLIQINAGYFKNDEPNLEITFLHANSFKPMEQNKTLGSIGKNYGIKYYMEFISVKFSRQGKPVSVKLRETLLGKEEAKSKTQFLDTYKSF
jgi:hypothetical protein